MCKRVMSMRCKEFSRDLLEVKFVKVKKNFESQHRFKNSLLKNLVSINSYNFMVHLHMINRTVSHSFSEFQKLSIVLRNARMIKNKTSQRKSNYCYANFRFSSSFFFFFFTILLDVI